MVLILGLAQVQQLSQKAAALELHIHGAIAAAMQTQFHTEMATLVDQVVVELNITQVA